MLMGLEHSSLDEEFLKEKRVMVRGIAHPEFFNGKLGHPFMEFSVSDLLKVFGALPVSASNFFKLFSTKSHVLLYPGGVHEALHQKCEQYKLFWPDKPEFVRMAARFGATIVPFGAVGEDDVAEYVLDYNDSSMMKIPYLNDFLKENNEDSERLRADMTGEIANQNLFLPGVLPKLPGCFYFHFGKPIKTKGREKMLKDKGNANELYFQIKSEVESSLAYLIKKREEDPYRGVSLIELYTGHFIPLRMNKSQHLNLEKLF